METIIFLKRTDPYQAVGTVGTGEGEALLHAATDHHYQIVIGRGIIGAKADMRELLLSAAHDGTAMIIWVASSAIFDTNNHYNAPFMPAAQALSLIHI